MSIKYSDFMQWVKDEAHYEQLSEKIKLLEKERNEIYESQRALQKQIVKDSGIEIGTNSMLFFQFNGNYYQLNQYGIYPILIEKIGE